MVLNFSMLSNQTGVPLMTLYTLCWYKENKEKVIFIISVSLVTTFFFFSVRLLSVLRGYSFFSSPPQRPITSDFEEFFYPRFYPLHLFSYLIFWERASILPFECSVLNKGSPSTIFITSLVWRGPWLGIEPGTSRTRSQPSTPRRHGMIGSHTI